MTSPLLIVALIALGVGLVCGAIVVLLIQLWRRREVVDSLVSPEQLVGMIGVVEVPFDRASRGKIRIIFKGSTMELSAFTDDLNPLSKGSRVLITEVSKNRIWVTSTDLLER